MKVSYYPGCSLESTGRSFDQSVRAVCQALGVELAEIDEWACCGSSPGEKVSHLLSTALAVRTLNQVRRQELTEVMAPCPFCFRRLKAADGEIRADGSLDEQVGEVLGEHYPGGIAVHNMLSLLRERVGLEAIRARVTHPLRGLKVAPYYGCALVRPAKATGFDHPEDPQSMDEILEAIGADVVDWNFKTECCGAGLAATRSKVVVELSHRILEQARLAEAQVIGVACQLCQSNLDLRQSAVEARFKTQYRLPVVYFTQLMGLAFGLPAGALGLEQHVVDTRRLREVIGHPAVDAGPGVS